ncbi:MAG: glycine dehydrogenase (aminomethyl-transferring), partial [Gemmatimonadota bacterium]
MTDENKTVEGADRFVTRHIGPRPDDVRAMLDLLNYASLDVLVDAAVPEEIRLSRPLDLAPARSEFETLRALRQMASHNEVFTSYIGMGYANCIVPQVIQRNILENPGWYTAYTPYQPEIAQGRLEALLNFQTAISDLTRLEVANASLLDEGTAAAEAMAFSVGVSKNKADVPIFLVDEGCHPQTIAVVQTRGAIRDIQVVVSSPDGFPFGPDVVGALVQYPSTEGKVEDFSALCERAHEGGAIVTAAADLLSLAMIVPPGEWGADVAIGNTQRFGVPLGYGGPHAAYFATRQVYKRHIPGRIIGVSKDPAGRPVLRMALQTREQHIRREKATSNICTAQVLLAVMAGMYCTYHGPERIKGIAVRVHRLTTTLADALRKLGYQIVHDVFFDTITIATDQARAAKIHETARSHRVNLRPTSPTRIGVTLDETTSLEDVNDLVSIFALGEKTDIDGAEFTAAATSAIPGPLRRTSPFLTHECFNRYHSETEMMRYLKRLEDRDLSLTSAMIPLGSCTMKLNAATQMHPVSWPEFGGIHPFAPREQAQGYQQLLTDLGSSLSEIT